MKEQDVQRLQTDGLHGEEVGGEDAVSLSPEELGPGGPWRRLAGGPSEASQWWPRSAHPPPESRAADPGAAWPGCSGQRANRSSCTLHGLVRTLHSADR